jgi:hypothetical protein
MNLTPPSPQTRVIRRGKQLELKAGKWHFLKAGSDHKPLCGAFISLQAPIEYSILGDIHGNLCPNCYPGDDPRKV